MRNKEAESETLDYLAHRPILALALARTHTEEFTTHWKTWYEAVFEIYERFKKSVPELKAIQFVMVEPDLPESRQVLELITILELRGLIDNFPGGDQENTALEMNATMKGEIEDELGKRLVKYQTQIAEMSEIFERHLKLG